LVGYSESFSKLHNNSVLQTCKGDGAMIQLQQNRKFNSKGS